MSEILTNNKYYKDIADTIRQMKGVATTYKPREMAGALRNMYSTEVEGVPPLTFPSNGNNLLNYRIDGASGGVGDRTTNLFYGEIVRGSFDSTTGALTTAPNRIRMDGNTFIFLPAGTYTLFAEGVESCILYAYTLSNLSTYDRNNSVISWQELPYTFTVAEARYFLLGFRLDNNSSITPDIISNIMLNAGSNILSYEPYGYKIPVVISGKNLLQNTATSQTISEVTFTVNEDGSVTCNGTATNNIFFPLTVNDSIENIIINGCPAGGSGDSYLVRAIDTNGRVLKTDFGEGTEAFNLINAKIQIRIAKDYICNNLTFYPMIRLATIEDDTYEPYIEPTTTNIYLDEPIEVNESKELSDTNVNISTINGTNILSVNTTVQPSNVYVQAPKNNSYNI